MLEDKNILINTEAIKSVDFLIRVMKEKFPLSKLKHILTLIVEKVYLLSFRHLKHAFIARRQEEDNI